MSFIRGTIFPSVTDQKPNPYWTFDDPYPQYVQVQRTPATISGSNIRFNVNTFDPNTFLRSKAYIKVVVTIQKQERNPVDGVIVAANYTTDDRIYKKSGMVLMNSCINARLRLNSHTMNYQDLRYVGKKLNTSFAGLHINNNYLSTSGSAYENLNGVYDEFGRINSPVLDSTDLNVLSFTDLGFDVGAGLNTIAYIDATGIMTFAAGGGAVINLLTTQHFKNGDLIELAGAESFVVGVTTSTTTIKAVRRDAQANLVAQDLVVADEVQRHPQEDFNGDDGRQIAYDETFRDINVGATNSAFNFTEPLSFGPFNHLADYESGEIYKNCWNLKQSKLIPYIRELELNLEYRDIAANALIYSYGRNSNVAARECQLVDINIVSAELVLFWVKPRDELLVNMPRCVRIQSWMYEHKQFDLGVVNNEANVVSAENNIYTEQVPSYLMYFAMVDKDSAGYVCRAVNTDGDNAGRLPIINITNNSVEAGMHILPLDGSRGSDFTLRSNTLGGDDILDIRYNQKELYRIMLKNSVSDFPYSETKFRGLLVANQLTATYPSQFYIFLGEQELNSFFIRKGQLQVSNVMNFNSTLVAEDGYSISKGIQQGAFNGGNKTYALHIFYIYDRFYIQLDDDGFVDSKFDSSFF